MYLDITIPWCKLKKINRWKNIVVTQAYTFKSKGLFYQLEGINSSMEVTVAI
jgi:hypothetical protein